MRLNGDWIRRRPVARLTMLLSGSASSRRNTLLPQDAKQAVLREELTVMPLGEVQSDAVVWR
ncbi:hypothetical protein EJB05_34430 [Eragrostis curvula]|uniref:Uncharacterized protein n=1 Tax=Eragrostis curvula TaxID=38414 RepID=A0A5J9SQU7_9POAL|nr:hypothetical protein EJB05_53175 [Eragrostis curvula]TVU18340.1 hypothetical protein EJB05_34430 [Eragrostis curvula]